MLEKTAGTPLRIVKRGRQKIPYAGTFLAALRWADPAAPLRQ